MRLVEIPFEVEGCFSAQLSKFDDSFDHAQGRKIILGLDLDDLRVIIWINGIDYDITGSFSESQLENFKLTALKHQLD